eukprot:COSAG03_NODE_11049_length_614_cov_1.097087_2_plen_25_part_01
MLFAAAKRYRARALPNDANSRVVFF